MFKKLKWDAIVAISAFLSEMLDSVSNNRFARQWTLWLCLKSEKKRNCLKYLQNIIWFFNFFLNEKSVPADLHHFPWSAPMQNITSSNLIFVEIHLNIWVAVPFVFVYFLLDSIEEIRKEMKEEEKSSHFLSKMTKRIVIW